MTFSNLLKDFFDILYANIRHIILLIWKNNFQRLHIIIIEIFKFHKKCINMHDNSNINITTFEWSDFEKVSYIKM